MLNPDNATLEWCAKWIEDSLRAETNERTIEFGRNMAMTIRAVKTKDAAPVVADDEGGLPHVVYSYEALDNTMQCSRCKQVFRPDENNRFLILHTCAEKHREEAREELKACPFCDSTPDVFEDGEIQCSNKKCPVRPSARWGGAEIWNTRSRASVAAVESDAAWLPIDTAPKDETEIILACFGSLSVVPLTWVANSYWLPACVGGPLLGRTDIHCVCCPDDPSYTGKWKGWDSVCAYDPTHWMPMPPAPNAAAVSTETNRKGAVECH